MNNEISFKLTDEEITQLDQAVETITKVLGSKLTTLDPERRRELLHMGDKSVAFVEKSLEYADMYPKYLPEYIDVPESKIDFVTVKTLRKYFAPIETITNGIDDTMRLAGSEAFGSALVIYKSLKAAAKLNLPGAQEAVSELKNRFPGTRKKKVEETTSAESN